MPPSRIVLTGATGFIGQHFMCASADVPIRALTRLKKPMPPESSGVEWVVGDLAARESWRQLLEPGCTVINLAYPAEFSLERSVMAVQTMVAACAESKVARLIHCSTVSVYGRTAGGAIDESTPCNPRDAYGRQKLAIERAILDSDTADCEVAILRPAAVFGVGGQNLASLVNSLCSSAHAANYLRASLFGRRKMHLVPVQTVVAALRFLVDSERCLSRQIFNVAEDEDPHNNFLDVEQIIIESLCLPRRSMPLVPVPSVALRALLWMRGRSELDPQCTYRSEKLREWGFASPIGVENALRVFATRFFRTDHN